MHDKETRDNPPPLVPPSCPDKLLSLIHDTWPQLFRPHATVVKAKNSIENYVALERGCPAQLKLKPGAIAP